MEKIQMDLLNFRNLKLKLNLIKKNQLEKKMDRVNEMYPDQTDFQFDYQALIQKKKDDEIQQEFEFWLEHQYEKNGNY